MDEPRPNLRVALVGCTGLLGDIIRQTLSSEPDLDVVAQLANPGPGQELAQLDADIVLWNEADEDLIARWLRAITRDCTPRVLAILADGQGAALWELIPQRIEIGELSPRSLVETLRAAKAGSVS